MGESQPSVLLVDDGELGDVREILEELGADFVHLRGGQIPETLVPPRDMVVTSPRRAADVAARGGTAAELLGGPLGIVVVEEDSPALRQRLRGGGYDYLVRRPVRRELLRLLLLRALYRGPERRGALRVPRRGEVTLEIGLKRVPARLADLSRSGCRLLLDRHLEIGTSVVLEIPTREAGAGPLRLPARVARSESDPEGGGTHVAGLHFARPEPEVAARFEGLLSEAGAGPVEPVAEGRAAGDPPVTREQRAEPRRRFEGPITELAGEAGRVLLGRDLSTRGMRVEPRRDIRVGDRLRLALHAEPGAEPLVVDAVVSRDDGPRGLALHFVSLSEEDARRLEAVVADLPTVETLGDGEAASLGAVLSEVLPAQP